MRQNRAAPHYADTPASAPAPTGAEAGLLDTMVAQSALPPQRADGIALGVLDGFDASGRALVSIAAFGLTGVPASTLVTLADTPPGAQLALGFESANPQRPIILGLMLAATASPQRQHASAGTLEARVDGQRVVLEAEREIELRCGEAAILLTADGRIELRGTYITSHASATQRILGGSVNIN